MPVWILVTGIAALALGKSTAAAAVVGMLFDLVLLLIGVGAIAAIFGRRK